MIEILSLPKRKPAGFTLPRLGFAGVGWIGQNRLQALVDADAAQVSALFDPAADAVERLRVQSPDALVAHNFEELLELPLDGIVIATPSALHATQAIAALDHGLAVFCQKPLGRNGEETERVITASCAADRLLHVDLSYRFHAGMQAIRSLIQRGELGEVYAIEGVFHNAYGPDKPWFYDATLSGGGCLLDLGIHLVDLALWALDFPEVRRVSGQLLHQGRPLLKNGRAVEDYAATQLVLESGTSVQLACSWRAPAGCDAKIELTFFGTKGGATFSNVGGSFYDFHAEQLLSDRSRKQLAAPPDVWGGRAIVNWAHQLESGAGFDPEIEKLNRVAKALDQIYDYTE